MSKFVHLNVHSEYSFLQSTISIEKLIGKAKELNQHAVALTDYSSMFGVMEFYWSAKRAGIKPIIGCEFNVARGSFFQREYSKNSLHRLILLAKNNIGYRNLMHICTAAHLNSKSKYPRIKGADLKGHSKGLICFTCNYQGELGYYLVHNEMDKSNSLVTAYQALFGKKNVYLCVQDHGLKKEETTNSKFLQLHKKENLRLVAINDVHYLNQNESFVHEVLLCINDGTKLSKPNHPHFHSNKYYLRSSEEMEKLFSSYPGAIENSAQIAEECSVDIEVGKLNHPKYPVPKGYSADKYLSRLVNERLKKKFNVLTVEVRQRINYELETIKKIGASNYLLIVQDFINEAKRKQIPTGPGRGPVVGSLVSYVLGITDINPLRYNLLFERFLNPNRLVFPDIDPDFSDIDRHKVIKYVVNRYGKECVSYIVTHGRMRAKMSLRDVGRVLGFTPQKLNMMCKLFPKDAPFADLSESIKRSQKLRQAFFKTTRTKQLKEIALTIEGNVRQVGRHAVAVIVASSPITHFSPLFKHTEEATSFTQYDQNCLENLGLLKLDLLGLRNLSVLNDCVASIRKHEKKILDITRLPENDTKTLDLFNKGQTIGVFQFESQGMQKHLRQLKPVKFDSLVALNALYRPGPFEYLPSFVSRKKGSEPVQYYHQDLEEILKETYGIIVYQEQIMLIANVIAGFSYAEGDILRRAFAKRQTEKLTELEIKYMKGAAAEGYTKKLAKEIWDILSKVSCIAFNKAHSVAYTTIAYQSAYLKAHYPDYYFSAEINLEKDDLDRCKVLREDYVKTGLHLSRLSK